MLRTLAEVVLARGKKRKSCRMSGRMPKQLSPLAPWMFKLLNSKEPSNRQPAGPAGNALKTRKPSAVRTYHGKPWTKTSPIEDMPQLYP